jgi:flagellar basal-body rod modification protein FlgD
MQVTAANTTAASQTTSNATPGADNTLNYNNFLQLLVAQLKNQDPTNPSDPTTFVSQLASFSSVEQQVNTNSKLDALLTQTELAQAGSIIGRTVTSLDGSVSGQVASLQITSSGLTATLTDGQTLTLGAGVVIS